MVMVIVQESCGEKDLVFTRVAEVVTVVVAVEWPVVVVLEGWVEAGEGVAVGGEVGGEAEASC